MSGRDLLWPVLAVLLLAAAPASPTGSKPGGVPAAGEAPRVRVFLDAVSAYQAGEYRDAAEQLGKLETFILTRP